MKASEISKRSIKLNVDVPTCDILGEVVDLEDVSYQTKNAVLDASSEEDCVASGELYKPTSKSDGLQYVDKCKVAGEKAYWLAIYTRGLQSSFYETSHGDIAVLADKADNQIVSFVDIATKCKVKMYVVEAVNEGDVLEVSEGGYLQKRTTGVPVCVAKESIAQAGRIYVGFGENMFVPATSSEGGSETTNEETPANNTNGGETNGETNGEG